MAPARARWPALALAGALWPGLAHAEEYCFTWDLRLPQGVGGGHDGSGGGGTECHPNENACLARYRQAEASRQRNRLDGYVTQCKKKGEGGAAPPPSGGGEYAAAAQMGAALGDQISDIAKGPPTASFRQKTGPTKRHKKALERLAKLGPEVAGAYFDNSAPGPATVPDAVVLPIGTRTVPFLRDPWSYPPVDDCPGFVAKFRRDKEHLEQQHKWQRAAYKELRAASRGLSDVKKEVALLAVSEFVGIADELLRATKSLKHAAKNARWRGLEGVRKAMDPNKTKRALVGALIQAQKALSAFLGAHAAGDKAGLDIAWRQALSSTRTVLLLLADSGLVALAGEKLANESGAFKRIARKALRGSFKVGMLLIDAAALQMRWNMHSRDLAKHEENLVGLDASVSKRWHEVFEAERRIKEHCAEHAPDVVNPKVPDLPGP